MTERWQSAKVRNQLLLLNALRLIPKDRLGLLRTFLNDKKSTSQLMWRCLKRLLLLTSLELLCSFANRRAWVSLRICLQETTMNSLSILLSSMRSFQDFPKLLSDIEVKNKESFPSLKTRMKGLERSCFDSTFSAPPELVSIFLIP